MSEFQSLLEIYKQVDRKYYFLRSQKCFEEPTDENAEEYIKAYFRFRSKSGVFNIEFSDQGNLFKKSMHTVSMFWLGMYLQDLVKTQVKKLLTDHTRLEKKKFEYPWMLSCLYHDALSDYERKDSQYADLRNFCKNDDVKIEHTIYEMDLPEGIEVSCVEPTYQKETVEWYFKYRLNKSRVDHGIAAGYLLFDRLVKNYLFNREKNGGKDEFETSHEGHTLLWRKDQIYVFALAADAVIAHNIWHLVKEEGLPSEITQRGDAEKKLSVKGQPLAFICSLVDAIEPVKRFQGEVPVKEILENISVVHRENLITISWKETMKQYRAFWDWMKNIKSMEDWLEVKAEPCKCGDGECSLVITIEKETE